MSFVGPRPERPEFVAGLTEKIRFYGQRHVVRPGLTGWAQVCYTYGATEEDALQKLQFDLYYIKNLSIALDIYIIIETIKTVVLRKGVVVAAVRQTNAMTVDVEDYFQVSVFEGVVPRERWASMESRVQANTERLLEPVRRVRREGHVLRARLGGGALSLAGAGDRRSRARAGVARLRPPAGLRPDAGRVPAGRPAREGAARGRGRRGGARLPGAQLLGDPAVDVGARCAVRGRLPLRRQHLSHSPRSVRHPRCAALAASRGLRRRPHLRSARFHRPRRWHEPAGRRRRLLPDPAVRVDALGPGPAERAGRSAGGVLPASLGDRPGAAAACRPTPWGVSGTTATFTRPSRACGR